LYFVFHILKENFELNFSAVGPTKRAQEYSSVKPPYEKRKWQSQRTRTNIRFVYPPFLPCLD